MTMESMNRQPTGVLRQLASFFGGNGSNGQERKLSSASASLDSSGYIPPMTFALQQQALDGAIFGQAVQRNPYFRAQQTQPTRLGVPLQAKQQATSAGNIQKNLQRWRDSVQSIEQNLMTDQDNAEIFLLF